jgi:hypothetical protein
VARFSDVIFVLYFCQEENTRTASRLIQRPRDSEPIHIWHTDIEHG